MIVKQLKHWLWLSDGQPKNTDNYSDNYYYRQYQNATMVNYRSVNTDIDLSAKNLPKIR